MKFNSILLIGFLILLFSFSQVLAIKITEIEIDPKDNCSDCTEWVELYSEEEINLTGYYFENNKLSQINLSGDYNGYFTIGFGKRFLTNSGDRLSLMKEGEIIVSTPILIDNKNNESSWQFCDGEWKFRGETKGEENNCSEEPKREEAPPVSENLEVLSEESEEESRSEKDKSDDEESAGENDSDEFAVAVQQKEINLSPISLNPQNIKTNDGNPSLKKSLALCGIFLFCAAFGALFFLKKRRFQNEFK